MLNDPDHDHDHRPPRDVCIHDPLAITPADAPRRDVLDALAKAEADEPDATNSPNDFALDLQRAREALGLERTALCELHIAVREWLTDPSGTTWAALAAVHPDFRRALDGWTTAGARMRHPETTPEVAPYSWIMRDLSSQDAVTRYTLARRRDNLVLVVDAYDDRRRIRDLEGATLPSTTEVDELTAGDRAATPDLLATIEDTLRDTAPEGHEVERVNPLPCTRGYYGSIHRCVMHDGAWMIGDTNRCERTGSAPVTAEEIARLRALEQAATPRPWATMGFGVNVSIVANACTPMQFPVLQRGTEQVAAPPLPPETHGVTIAVLSTDPPVALLTFDPLGVLGEDIHLEHNETVTVLRGAVVVVTSPQGAWPKREEAIGFLRTAGAISTRITAGEAHTLRAGVEGAMILVAMTQRWAWSR